MQWGSSVQDAGDYGTFNVEGNIDGNLLAIENGENSVSKIPYFNDAYSWYDAKN